jgi:hypothetical protein
MALSSWNVPVRSKKELCSENRGVDHGDGIPGRATRI